MARPGEKIQLQPTAHLNGYRPRSYGDLVAVATLLAMLVSVVGWGLKLEGELNDVRNDLVRVQGQVGHGILPRAEERIESLRRDLTYLAKEYEKHDEDRGKHNGR